MFKKQIHILLHIQNFSILLFKKKKQIYLQNIYQKNYLMHQI